MAEVPRSSQQTLHLSSGARSLQGCHSAYQGTLFEAGVTSASVALVRIQYPHLVHNRMYSFSTALAHTRP